MGLLLSVLVACVGVVELLAFYSNIRRSLVTTSTQTNLADLNKRYLEDFERLKLGKSATNHVGNNIKGPVVCNTTITTTSSEDIELEFDRNLVRAPSPRRFLLTEKENQRSKSPSPRRFLVSDEKLSNGTAKNLREFTVESKNGEGALESHYVIKDQDQNGTAFPLPKQFIVTEAENAERERSPSPPKKLNVGEQEVFRRSPSPYPSLVLSVPRNSICSEHLENPGRVDEVDEDSLSKSPTPEKFDEIVGPKSNGTEYRTNKVLVVPSANRRSHTPECDKDDTNLSNETNDYNDQFLDSLDGVKKKKISRNNSTRKSRKKRTDDCLSSSSLQHNDSQTAKTLTEAASVLKNVNPADGDSAKPGTSKDGDSKSAEPFWVNG